jgi:hypothetical protein
VYSDASWKGVTYACNWTNRFIGNGNMSLVPVAFPPPLTGIVTRDSVPVGGKERWVIVVWNPVHEGMVNTRFDLGTGISRAVVHDYASPATTVLAVSAGATGIDLQIGYEPVLLVIDCDVGGTCAVIVTGDILGGVLVGMLVMAVVLVIGTFALVAIGRRRVLAPGVR